MCLCMCVSVCKHICCMQVYMSGGMDAGIWVSSQITLYILRQGLLLDPEILG